jgi:hypothetical protein
MKKINLLNPWDQLDLGSIRRVEADLKHNIFWFKDAGGSYGLRISLQSIFEKESDEQLEGISLARRNNNGKGEFFILLTNKADWEIFYDLINNLTGLAEKYTVEATMIKAIENRLTRWKTFLKQGRTNFMSTEKQMGLITELIFLKDVLAPKFGIESAIISWVGCSKDKQDFVTQNALFEVKSYRITKGKKIKISSIDQLNSQKDPLYLICYGVSINKNGLSIKTIVDEIIESFLEQEDELFELFENKLFEYGYHIQSETPSWLINLVIEALNIYEVLDSFPKLKNLDSRIDNVKYTINLEGCDEYITETKNLFNNVK